MPQTLTYVNLASGSGMHLVVYEDPHPPLVLSNTTGVPLELLLQPAGGPQASPYSVSPLSSPTEDTAQVGEVPVSMPKADRTLPDEARAALNASTNQGSHVLPSGGRQNPVRRLLLQPGSSLPCSAQEHDFFRGTLELTSTALMLCWNCLFPQPGAAAGQTVRVTSRFILELLWCS